jgi:phosphate transport system substrate-binding protein
MPQKIKAFLKYNLYLYTLVYTPIIALTFLIAYLFMVFRAMSALEIYSEFSEDMGLLIASALALIHVAAIAFIRSKQAIADSYFRSYFALILPIVITLIGGNIFYYCLFTQTLMMGEFDRTFFSLMHVFAFAVYIVFAAIIAIALLKKKHKIANKKPIYLSLAIIAALIAILLLQIAYNRSYMIDEDTQNMTQIGEGGYYGGATPLDQSPAILFYNDPPQLDGATAFYPIYYSAARALYKQPSDRDGYIFYDYVKCTTTSYAYERLIDSKTDLVFAFAPSQEQEEFARKNDVELVLTPIGKEAFVFLVNEENPVKSLTIEQIQKIYTGEFNNWRDVGGENAKILAFQRYQNSGSQTAMEERVMKGLSLKRSLKETIETMEGLADIVADYRNAKNAIGYSFRYFITDMHKTQGVRL